MSPVLVNPSRFAVSGGGTGYSAQVLARSPVAYYRLGEASGTTMVDSSGNGRDGTYFNSPTLGSAGLITGDSDTAVTFNGTDQYGIVAYDAAWMDGWSQVSLIAWVKLASTGAYRDIVTRDQGGSAGPFRLRISSSNKLEFLLWHGGLTVLAGSTVFTAGTRYQVAATYNGVTMKTFVNGASNGTSSQTGALRFDVTPLRIARYGGSEYFAGVIDEVSIYNTGLSDADIAADYAAGS